jgi:EmrB/QacA subfamily drug resistance transporter
MADTDPHHARRWAILAILGTAQLMVVLDATVVNIALPSAQQALHFSSDNRQWIVTAYALAFGSLLLLGGRISDMFGRKWTFIAGLVGFSLASAVGGSAQSFGMLVIARTFQGAFGALLAPAALSLLTVTFTDGKERAKAFGIFSAVAASGASVGLLLGGVLTQTLNWRFCMYVNLIFATGAVIGALILLTNSRPAVRPKLDIPGTLAVSGGLFALVYGFSRAQTTSWTNQLTIGSLVLAVVLLVAFAVIQFRAKHPLLPPRVFLNRNRAASFISIGLTTSAMFAVFLFLTYYLQRSLGYSPIKTGLAFMPLTAVIMVTAVVGLTKLQGRFGPRWLAVSGMLLGTVGMTLLTRVGVHSTYVAAILPALLIMGVGMGLVFSTAIGNATYGVEAADAGVASATLNASQQVGGSIGVALLSTLAASAVTSYIGGQHRTSALLAQATVHGYTTAFGFAAGIFLIGAVAAAVLFSGKVRSGEPVAKPVAEPALAN